MTTSDARPHTPSRNEVEDAFHTLLAALGRGSDDAFRDTPARATELWLQHLLAAETVDPTSVLGSGIPTQEQTPIVVRDVGITMVCPHHMTVGFGKGQVAYTPNARIIGFGRISELIRACTQRFILQEDAAALIAQSLFDALTPLAVVARLDVLHPCHNVLEPRAHDSMVTCWSERGAPEQRDVIRQLLLAPQPAAAR